MLLYHGTSERAIDRIRHEGLRPRTETKKSGNWRSTILSNPKTVYLTECYAGYFAFVACRGLGRFGILEIDTEKLDNSLLVPDEDSLAQYQVQVRGGDLMKLTEYYRKLLPTYQGTEMWKTSLKLMGTCGFMGTVPPGAIQRVNVFDARASEVHNAIGLKVADPSITLMNYRILGKYYKELTKVLMGDVDPEAFYHGDSMLKYL